MTVQTADYLSSLYGLDGKVALVTGGATGIGRMVAEALVCAGAKVFIASRKGADCARVADELNALGASGSAEGFGADVSTEEGINALSAEIAKRTDKLHILFNNSGVSWGAPMKEFPHAAWEKVMNINVAAAFTLTRNLFPLLKASATDEDPARIVNIGSIMGMMPFADGAYSYSASKAAVLHLTQILAQEFASKRITVNAFAPGPFQSRMTAFATDGEEKAAKVGAGVPLGRIGLPTDIAGATLYLCGKAGAYVTGTTIPIDGGLHNVTHTGLFNLD